MAKEDSDELFKDFDSDEDNKKKGKKSQSGSKSDDVKEVVFRYRPILLERVIFIAVILGLLGFIVYTTFWGSSCASNQVSGFPVVTPPADNQISTEPVVEVKNDTKTSSIPEPTPEPTPTGNGKFTLTIDKIDFERGGNDSTPLKMKSIAYTIDNQKVEVLPVIKVYWYDSDSDDAIKAKVRSSFTFGTPIKVGDKISGTLKTFDSYYFDKSRDEEIIVVEVFNSKNDQELASKTQVIK